MKHAGTLSCLLGAFILCTEADAKSTDSNPYQGIIDRNIFGLRPPPPPPSNEPVKPPPPAIALTGITTILGKKLAFMNVQVPPKPGEPQKGGPQSFMLGVGEREGEVEVLEIDEKEGVVKVNDYGVVTNVPFAKLPNTPAAPVTTAGIPSPMNPNVPGAPPQRSIPGLPQRTLRLGNNAQNGSPSTGNAYSPGYSTANPQANQANRDVPMTPEEQVIMMEANREILKSKGDPAAGLLPPTQLTSPEDLRSLMTPGSRLPKGYQQPAPAPMPQ